MKRFIEAKDHSELAKLHGHAIAKAFEGISAKQAADVLEALHLMGYKVTPEAVADASAPGGIRRFAEFAAPVQSFTQV